LIEGTNHSSIADILQEFKMDRILSPTHSYKLIKIEPQVILPTKAKKCLKRDSTHN
jgi:hypothetical protein